jgi:hypothetical protein
VLQPADRAWLALVGGAIVFELSSDDLLSESSLRFVAAHPLLGRLAILAVATHLSGVLPWPMDVFDSRNLLHLWAVKGYRMVRYR